MVKCSVTVAIRSRERPRASEITTGGAGIRAQDEIGNRWDCGGGGVRQRSSQGGECARIYNCLDVTPNRLGFKIRNEATPWQFCESNS